MKSFNHIFSSLHTDKAYPHSYGEIYDKYFDATARSKVHKFLEIGVQAGDCLKGYGIYFPNAMIFGVDINPDYMITDSPFIVTLSGDQSDPHFLRTVGGYGKFDVIVDDGSHDPRHQLKTLLYLWEYLQRGGIYIIEDIVTSSGITGFSPHNITELFALLPGDLYDRREISNTKNDTIVVLTKE